MDDPHSGNLRLGIKGKPVTRATAAVRSGHILALFVVISALTSSAHAADTPHLKMGNPSQAKKDPVDKNNYLLDRNFFALSYNNDYGTPNWVSWRLANEDLGKAPRKSFHHDTDLPRDFNIVTTRDYLHLGMDRGHLCPHGDRSKSDESSLATFMMTNMVPQSHDANTMAWNQLEIYLRDLVSDKRKVCYIVAGPAGKGGIGKDGFHVKTPGGKVVVPSLIWKVAMILDEDVASARDFKPTSNIRLIAVVMPNVDGAVNEDWAPFRTTVKEVEDLTGFKFFGDVESSIIGPLKEQEDEEIIPSPTPVIRGRR